MYNIYTIYIVYIYNIISYILFNYKNINLKNTNKKRNLSESSKFSQTHKLKQNTRRRQWHPTPALSPGKSHGWRSLVGCSPWGS